MSGRTSERPFPQLVGGGGSVVVAGERFGARARARRRRIAVAWVVLVACLAAAGWVVGASSWGTVQRIEVTGTERIGAVEVTSLAQTESGRSLLLVHPADLERRIRALRLVADVSVRREWPGTLVVEVRERQPVAALPRGDRYQLVDRDGVEVEVVGAVPGSLPVLQVDLVTAGTRALRSALDSLAVMPAGLRSDIREVGAASRDGVWFRLADGDRVVWGNAGQIDLKVAALDALRRQTARERSAERAKGFVTVAKRTVTFDVSAPRAPSVQR